MTKVGLACGRYCKEKPTAYAAGLSDI